MLSRGSAKTFVTQVTPTFTTSETDDHRSDYYFSASAGFSYMNSDNNLNLIGQYYYNGEGYADSDRETLISQAKAAINSLGGADAPAAAPFNTILKALIYGSGRHYGAINFSKGKILTDDLSASVIVVANLSDFSGLIKPSLSYRLSDNLSLALSPTFIFGPEDGEYSYIAGGNIVSLSLGMRVNGSF